MNSNSVRRTLPVVLCCWAVLCSRTAAAAPKDEPHLVFQKSVVVRDYRDGRVYLAPHRIRKGDYLWKILRDHYHMNNRSIAFYCRVARTMNSEVRNIDLLRPNQRILVPYRFVPGAATDNATGTAADTALAAAVGAVPDNATDAARDNATAVSHGRTAPDPLLGDVAHVIARGEYLNQLLRERFNLPAAVLFSSRTLALLKEANPHISDFNRLEVGQRIVFPAELVRAARPETAAPVASAPVAAPAPVVPRIDAQARRSATLVGSLARAFDGVDNQTGIRVVDAGEGVRITLDQSRNPVYSFPWQRDVVLDYGGQMPPALREVIGREWKSAEIVSVREKDDMAALLDKVLQASGACKVERQAHYIANRGGVQIRVSGDWIVFTDELLKNVFVVNLVDDSRRHISPALEGYIESLGLKVVNLRSDGTAAPAAQEQTAARAPARKVTEAVLLTDAILDAAGIDCHRDYNTQIFQNRYSGVSLEVLADRMFRRDGTGCIIDFHGLPESIIAIIRQQGFRVMQVDRAGQDLQSIAGQVIEFCGFTTQQSPASFGNDDRSTTRLRLTVPGIVFAGDSGNVLVTGVELDQAIIDFLDRQNVHIITY